MIGYRLSGTLCAVATISAVVLSASWPTPAKAQQFNRLAAEFNYYGLEAETSLTANSNPTHTQTSGVAVYKRVVTVPAGQNVIFATISTTGDVHDGASSCFTALLDGKYFAPRPGGPDCDDSVSVPGWITLLKVPNGPAPNCVDSGDCHDNNIYYQWCRKVTAGSHEVQIRLASSRSGSNVYIEQAHFYVDTAKMSSLGCTAAVTPTGADAPKVKSGGHKN